ncbi:hypothetical protein BDD12DRAFT_867731 [Trichophaea hybrida]|nr:hypothetical protein BDD12DRAFT_867731 [Trichophaea hybrida]
MVSPSTPPNKPRPPPIVDRSTKPSLGVNKNSTAHLRQFSHRPSESTFSRRERDDSFAARQKLVQLEAELKRVQAMHAIDKAELENKVRLLQEELDDTQQQLRQPLLSDEYRHLRSQFEVQFRKLILENKESGEKITVLQALVAKGKASELKNVELTKINAALEESLNKLKESSRQEKLYLMQESKDISARYNELQNHNKTLLSDIDELRKNFAELNKELATEKDKVIGLQLDKSQLQDELKESEERNQKLVARIHQMIKDQTLTTHRSEFDVDSVIGSRSRSQPTDAPLSGYESDNDTVRNESQRAAEVSSTCTVDDSASNDSFEEEIDRILPERRDYIQRMSQSPTRASQVESNTQWDIDHEKDIIPISVAATTAPAAATTSPVVDDDTDPFSSSQAASGVLQSTVAESTVVKNDKDPWMEEKLKEIFRAVEIQYSEEEISRYIATPPSVVTPIQETFDRSIKDETPTRKGNVMSGDTSEETPELTAACDDSSVPTDSQGQEDHNKTELTKADDAAEYLKAMAELETISVSSSVSHCDPIMPWTENALPDKFELIRELIFTKIPVDVVRLENVFKQLTTGLIEKVHLNRKSRVLRIIFVEPLAAREQYIKFYNRGLYIPKGSAPPQSSTSSASSAANGKKALEQYHVLMPNSFEYTANSDPLSSELRDAIYKGHLTRVCRMRGPTEGMSATKLQNDLFKSVPGFPKNHLDVFDSIHIDEEAGEVLIRFTAMVYSARTFNFLKTSLEYSRYIPDYGPDPCNRKSSTEVRLNHKQTPESTVAMASGKTEAKAQNKEPQEKQSSQGSQEKQPNQEILEDTKVLHPAPLKSDLKFYTKPGTGGVDNMNPAQINYMLSQLAERGLISNKVLRARGLLPPAGAKWDNGVDSDEAKTEGNNWAAREANAVKAYRASLKERDSISARAAPVIPDLDTVYAREDYSTRLVFVAGLPSYITYGMFCPYVKGGAVDTIRLDPEEGTAVIIFLRAKDATNYRDYITVNKIYIDGHRMINQHPSLTRLHNMRLWDPVKVLREGLSRCVFIEGIPNGTIPSTLEADIASMNQTVKIEYESITINGVCARVCCPTISMANFIHRNLCAQPKYTGVRVRYEEDFCMGHISCIGQVCAP